MAYLWAGQVIAHIVVVRWCRVRLADRSPALHVTAIAVRHATEPQFRLYARLRIQRSQTAATAPSLGNLQMMQPQPGPYGLRFGSVKKLRAPRSFPHAMTNGPTSWATGPWWRRC
jgi:hypothetical protein